MAKTLRIEVSTDHNPAATPVDGQYIVAFIRKELRADEVYPDNVRYNPTLHRVEYSPDGGTTWVASPASDPRNMTLLPPQTGSGANCNSAASQRAYMTRWRTVFDVIGAVGSTALTMGSLIVGVLGGLPGPWGLIFDVAVGVGSVAIAAGKPAVATALDDTNLDLVECVIYCHLSPTNQLDDSRLALVQSDISTLIGGTSATILNALLGLQGSGGINNAMALKLATDDCSDCATCNWCYTFDFTLDPYLFQSGPGANASSWSPGVGFIGGNFNSQSVASCAIYRAFASPLHLTSAVLKYTKTAGSGANNVNNFRLQHPVGTAVASNTANSLGTALSKTITYSGDVDQITCDVNSGTAASTVRILSITLHGTGSNPFGSDNC